jgi:hypothetical protein
MESPKAFFKADCGINGTVIPSLSGNRMLFSAASGESL